MEPVPEMGTGSVTNPRFRIISLPIGERENPKIPTANKNVK